MLIYLIFLSLSFIFLCIGTITIFIKLYQTLPNIPINESGKYVYTTPIILFLFLLFLVISIIMRIKYNITYNYFILSFILIILVCQIYLLIISSITVNQIAHPQPKNIYIELFANLNTSTSPATIIIEKNDGSSISLNTTIDIESKMNLNNVISLIQNDDSQCYYTTNSTWFILDLISTISLILSSLTYIIFVILGIYSNKQGLFKRIYLILNQAKI